MYFTWINCCVSVSLYFGRVTVTLLNKKETLQKTLKNKQETKMGKIKPQGIRN